MGLRQAVTEYLPMHPYLPHKAILLRGKDKSRSLRFWKKTQTWSEGELAKSHPPLWHTQWRKERLFTLKHSRQRLLKLPILGSGKSQKSANFLTKATIASTWECYSCMEEEEERVRGHSINFAGLSLLSCHVLVTITYSDLALAFIYYYIYYIILLLFIYYIMWTYMNKHSCLILDHVLFEHSSQSNALHNAEHIRGLW